VSSEALGLARLVQRRASLKITTKNIFLGGISELKTELLILLGRITMMEARRKIMERGVAKLSRLGSSCRIIPRGDMR
jgi:hypothetical protein